MPTDRRTNPFDFNRGTMPQTRGAFKKALDECARRGIDPTCELSWGPVPVQKNLLLALHPAPSTWAWKAVLALMAELLRAGPFSHLYYVYDETRWHLVVVEMTDQLNGSALAFARVTLGPDGTAQFDYEGVS